MNTFNDKKQAVIFLNDDCEYLTQINDALLKARGYYFCKEVFLQEPYKEAALHRIYCFDTAEAVMQRCFNERVSFVFKLCGKEMDLSQIIQMMNEEQEPATAHSKLKVINEEKILRGIGENQHSMEDEMYKSFSINDVFFHVSRHYIFK